MFHIPGVHRPCHDKLLTFLILPANQSWQPVHTHFCEENLREIYRCVFFKFGLGKFTWIQPLHFFMIANSSKVQLAALHFFKRCEQLFLVCILSDCLTELLQVANLYTFFFLFLLIKFVTLCLWSSTIQHLHLNKDSDDFMISSSTTTKI